MSSCIFCKIIAQELPATVIAENQDILVIKDINPKAPIHYLIIPKKHVPDITSFREHDTTLAGKTLMLAKELAQQLPGSKAFRLVVNNGADAGQCVFHAHIHFLAGKRLEF